MSHPADHPLLHSIPDVSPEQSAFYKENGFVVLECPSPELAQDLVEWTNEHLPHKTNAWLHYEEVDAQGGRTLTTTENFADHHAGFGGLFRGPHMLRFLRTLLGEEMVLFKEKINYKAPHSGGFKAHTDAPAYITVPNIGRVVGARFCHSHAARERLLETSRDDRSRCPDRRKRLPRGKLIASAASTTYSQLQFNPQVVAGSHKVEIPVGADHCLDDCWIASQTWTPLHLAPGQFVVFDSHLAHRSAENNTNSGRAAIFATYNALAGAGDKRAAYYADRRELWPATADRKPDDDYAVGASIFGFATPMLSVDATAYKRMGL
ncbi:hypothetical protein GGX14DRAFT_577517 [Mycena pura]|uniref:Phytanoyl-CoA dioxygenase n=1 Tax=Mycena pura TaxID=153505 RepID=A0AAD6Y3X9_9AGAR|nr:hypothetical protein GGX14DRAFT_577517 [Mycena pura]